MSGLNVEQIQQRLQTALSALAPLRDICGQDLHPLVLGRLTAIQVLDQQTHAALDIIPSETTPLERRLLRQFFASYWSGQHHVLEIGPFLGGTTRAIALGMLAHPSRAPHSRLKTFDRFSHYYGTEQLKTFCAPLLRAGLLDENHFHALSDKVCWKEIFEHIHGNTLYRSLLEIKTGALPDYPADDVSTEQAFCLQEGDLFDAIFVDGCKSWYGTKNFMLETLPHVTPDAWFIFQDYGWRTCFWLPVFIAATQSAWTLVTHVDATYVFRLRRPLQAAEVADNFPDTPEEMGEFQIKQIFSALMCESFARNDSKGVLVLHLQRAAALAYIGNHEESLREFDAMLTNPLFTAHRAEILATRKIPTYRPEGPVHLS